MVRVNGKLVDNSIENPWIQEEITDHEELTGWKDGFSEGIADDELRFYEDTFDDWWDEAA